MVSCNAFLLIFSLPICNISAWLDGILNSNITWVTPFFVIDKSVLLMFGTALYRVKTQELNTAFRVSSVQDKLVVLL